MVSDRADISDRQLATLSDVVYRHCGVDLRRGKKELVTARVAKRARAVGCTDLGEYLDGVLRDPGAPEFSRLIDALSTNLTCFFREGSHFIYLREQLLPGLVRQKESMGRRRIRAWSAGCSSGEEPYSIAMTVLDVLPDPWDFKLLATDISHPVLETARRGVYSRQRVAEVPPPLRSRFLRPCPAQAQASVEVGPDLRDAIRFNYLNLMKPWPFQGPMDFIFCRNVMIYFDKPTQESLVNRFHDALAPGGTLFTGHSESLTGINHPFRYVAPTIYARGGGGRA